MGRWFVAVLLALAGCTGVPRSGTGGTPAPTLVRSGSPFASPAPSGTHLFVIVLENHSYEQIAGNSEAPYLNELARRFGLATNYQGVAHPSLPNYLAIVGGSTFGISNDCTSCSVHGESVTDKIEAAGHTWRAYLEGMPSPCFRGGGSGRYAKKHNPFAYFDGPVSNGQRCVDTLVPLDRFATDVAAPREFSFIVPDLCHDMHDCSIATGDAWLRSIVPPILSSPAFGDRGILVVTFDEDDGGAANHVFTVVAGPGIAPGARTSRRLDHYDLLRSIEDAFGLPRLGHSNDPGRIGLLAAFRAP